MKMQFFLKKKQATYADPSESEADLPDNPEDPVQDAINEAVKEATEAASGILNPGDAK